MNTQLVLRKYYDPSKQENRYQVYWASDPARILDDSSAPGDIVHFLLGCCNPKCVFGPYTLTTIDEGKYGLSE